MCVAIILFETAYKRERKSLALYGIEMLVIAIANLGLLYVCIMNADKFMLVTLVISLVQAVYYIVKTIVVFVKSKKEIKNGITKISEEEV